MISLLQAALIYASEGWFVFPVVANTKFPLTDHGCKDATVDAMAIQKFWTTYPDANIGVATGPDSNLIVLDFDCKDGKQGLQSLAALRSKFNVATLEASTPSGGIHQYFRFAPGLKNSVELLPGMDVRTAGGYVVVAPSFADGKQYRWTRILPPAVLPDPLLRLLTIPKPKPLSVPRLRWMPSRLQTFEKARRYVAAVPPAVQGQAGDVATYKLACRLVRGFALSNDEAMVLLWTWNGRCRPPWSEAELRSKIASARRNGTEPFGARLEQN
jgi:hypothetical protein